MYKPLVSILIPAFNSEKWIADTLRSAIGQTWERKEIIVVDDGSTDRTLEIARSFESDWLSVVTQNNQGPSAARNTALSLSHGDYIQWLDADDLMAPDKIAIQATALEQCRSKRTLLSSAWAQFFFRYSRTEFVPTALWCDLSPTEWLLRKMESNLYMSNASWLVSRELTQAAGPWDCKQLRDNDGEYFCRVLLASDGVRFVPEAKVYYRVSGSASVSNIGLSGPKLDATWRSLKLHIGYLLSLQDSQRARAACVTFLQNWLIYFYPERLDIVKQAEQMAADLGGRLEVPHFSWKYAWIKTLFGWHLAKRAQLCIPQFKWFLIKSWDRALFRIETRRCAARLNMDQVACRE